MQISADQYRLLSAFESGKSLSLKQVREAHCPEQTAKRMLLTASELQRNRPALMRKLLAETKALKDDEDSVWQMTLDGYLFLMEQRQSQRIMAERNRCVRRPDGTDVYYRILRNQGIKNGDNKVVVQVRPNEHVAWQTCATGHSVSHALGQAHATGFDPDASC